MENEKVDVGAIVVAAAEDVVGLLDVGERPCVNNQLQFVRSSSSLNIGDLSSTLS